MHCANFSAAALKLAEFGGPAELSPPAAADELELPPLVAVVDGEEPPQPASASAALAAITATSILACSRLDGDGPRAPARTRLLGFISQASLSVLTIVPRRVLRNG
jgi:hypothetical protein